MHYPVMSRNREYRVSVPSLSGGVNLSVPPHLIADNQLAGSGNLWVRNDVLKTRPALDGVGRASHEDRTEYQYGSVGKFGYIVGRSPTYNYVTLVSQDGKVAPHMSRNSGDFKNINMMLAPVNGGLPTSVCDDDVIVYMKGDNEGNTGVFGITANDYERTPLTPYVPTVLINGRPQEKPFRAFNGDQNEPYNLLTDEYNCTFTPDGEGLYFSLPENSELVQITFQCEALKAKQIVTVEQVLNKDEVSGLYVGGANPTGYIPVYDKELNYFYFCEEQITGTQAYTVPVAVRENTDNSISVRLRRCDDWKSGRDTILGMRFSTWFGGGSEGISGGTRLFVGGNPDHPNLVHWSALNAPLYFPENNYAYVGDDTNAITAFGKQSDMLVIFKERELYYTTYNQGGAVSAEDIEAQTVVDIEAAVAVFPMLQLHPELGCDCPGTIQLCNNRLVWLNSDGKVYGLFSAGVYSERNLRVLSLQVESELRKFKVDERKAATATRYEDHYLLLVGGKLMVMDFSSYGFTYYSSYSSDEKAQKNVIWHIWNTDVSLLAAVNAGGGAVLIGTNGNEAQLYTYRLDDTATRDTVRNGSVVEATYTITSHLKTKLYDLGYPDRRKRVNSLYLQVSGAQGESVFLGYHSGDADYENKERLTLTGDTSESATPFRITPNMIRVRQFGVSLTSEGRIEVGSLILNYSMMGAMR